MQADGSWNYAVKIGTIGGPDADFFPDHQTYDVFSYTIFDGHGGYATAHLNILVHGDGGTIIGDPGSV